MNDQTDEKLLIEMLRRELPMTEEQATDEEVLKWTQGTIIRGRVELVMAIDDMTTALKEVLEEMKKAGVLPWYWHLWLKIRFLCWRVRNR